MLTYTIYYVAGILSKIVQTIYAVRPGTSRHVESVVLEGLLDKWHIELPDHLRHDPAAAVRSSSPSTSTSSPKSGGGGNGGAGGAAGGKNFTPQLLTLHLQYWCVVLLLHRPL